MSVVNIDEVKRDLSRYLEQVARGEKVVIASAGNPVAKLVPYRVAVAPRVPGYWKVRFASLLILTSCHPKLQLPCGVVRLRVVGYQ